MVSRRSSEIAQPLRSGATAGGCSRHCRSASPRRQTGDESVRPWCALLKTSRVPLGSRKRLFMPASTRTSTCSNDGLRLAFYDYDNDGWLDILSLMVAPEGFPRRTGTAFAPLQEQPRGTFRTLQQSRLDPYRMGPRCLCWRL